MKENAKESLFGKSTAELAVICRNLGLPGYAAGQIADWIYKKDVRTIHDMTNLSLAARRALDATYDVGNHDPKSQRESSDGTRKYLFSVKDTAYIETAYIPEGSRGTLCVSTQAGCARACRFCMTGRQGLQQNLSAGEILNQYASIPEKERITNIVYMGMGEPLDNLDEVLASLELFTSEQGYGLSPRRITVSTVGIFPQFERLFSASSCNIAVSFHSPWPEERARIMPVEIKHPIQKVLDFLKDTQAQQRARTRRRISFEYILFEGLNDSVAHAKQLVKILHGIRCRVNLIRYNPGEQSEFKPATNAATVLFRDTLNAKGVIATVRKSRGQDIDAACGLLSTRRML